MAKYRKAVTAFVIGCAAMAGLFGYAIDEATTEAIISAIAGVLAITAGVYQIPNKEDD